MANNELMIFGAGVMIGAAAPIKYQKEYNKLNWSVCLLGLLLVVIGVFI